MKVLRVCNRMTKVCDGCVSRRGDKTEATTEAAIDRRRPPRPSSRGPRPAAPEQLRMQLQLQLQLLLLLQLLKTEKLHHVSKAVATPNKAAAACSGRIQQLSNGCAGRLHFLRARFGASWLPADMSLAGSAPSLASTSRKRRNDRGGPNLLHPARAAAATRATVRAALAPIRTAVAAPTAEGTALKLTRDHPLYFTQVLKCSTAVSPTPPLEWRQLDGLVALHPLQLQQLLGSAAAVACRQPQQHAVS